MTTWVAIGLCVAVFGFGVIADDVDVDFPENVNSRFVGSRIVSGWEAEPGQHPYQTSIRMINSIGQVSACGGSVIHREWVMTAAHCTAGRINFVIRFGVVNLTTPEYIFEASTFFNHPQYNNALPGVVQPHDIGLLKLDRVLTLSKRLQPIRLQPSMHMNRNYDGERLIASGWGLTWTQGSSPENLNWVYLNGHANFDCWVQYGFSSIIVDSTICARYYNVTSQSTCQGDSGGPLTVVEEDGKRSMVGVASFVSGAGCHTEHPAGFIRPGHYHSWFQEITGINFDWNWDKSEEKSSSEQDKSSSEQDKLSSEQVNSSSEQDSKSSEQDKSSSEQDKSSSEQDKSSSEQDKSSSEQDKSSSEQDKSSSEQNKSSSEQIKSSSEQDKSSSEQDKSSSEQDKSSSEQDKSSSEQVKSSSEQDKSSSEQDKSSSEQDKSSSEQVKSSSEQDKSSSEQVKSSSEQDKSSSEQDKTSEQVKSSSEQDKSSSEQHKSSSEQDKSSSEQDKSSSQQGPSSSRESSEEIRSPEKSSEEASSEEHKPEPPSSEEHKPEPPSSDEHNPGWSSSEEVANKGSWSWFGKSDRM